MAFNQALRDELLNDPLGLGYAQYLPGSPGAALEILTNPNLRQKIQTKFITARTIAAEVQLEDARAVIGALKTLAATDPLVGAMWSFMLKDSGVDVGNTNAQQMLDQMATNSLITQQQADEVKNLAMQPCSRLVELGWENDGIDVVVLAESIA